MTPVIIICKQGLKPNAPILTTHTAKQSLYHNNPTYLISDFPVNIENKLFKQFNLNDFINNDFIKLQKNYIHLNQLPEDIVFMWISKYFILKKFMENLNLKKIFLIDYDVLLYTEIKKIETFYSQYDFTLSKNSAGSNSFFSYNMIKDFTEKVFILYEEKENNHWFNHLKQTYKDMLNQGLEGGICDMALLNFYKNCNTTNNKFIGGEMTQIINNKTFDHHIKYDDSEYKKINFIKNIKYVNKIPYCFNLKLKKYIQFLSLHFQGASKDFLHQHITYNL